MTDTGRWNSMMQRMIVNYGCDGTVRDPEREYRPHHLCPHRDTCMHYALGLLMLAHGCHPDEPKEDGKHVQNHMGFPACYVDNDSPEYTPQLVVRTTPGSMEGY